MKDGKQLLNKFDLFRSVAHGDTKKYLRARHQLLPKWIFKAKKETS
jgi:hypothetical protein